MLCASRKPKLLKNGEASVCTRITVNGVRVENNIRMSIDPALWNQAKECAKGKSRKACELNLYIEQAKIKLRKLFDELEERNHPVTARILQEKFFGINEEVKEVRNMTATNLRHHQMCIVTIKNRIGMTVPFRCGYIVITLFDISR